MKLLSIAHAKILCKTGASARELYGAFQNKFPRRRTKPAGPSHDPAGPPLVRQLLETTRHA